MRKVFVMELESAELNKLIDRAFTDNDICSALKQVGLPTENVRNRVSHKLEEVTKSSAPQEIINFESLEAEWNTKKEKQLAEAGLGHEETQPVLWTRVIYLPLLIIILTIIYIYFPLARDYINPMSTNISLFSYLIQASLAALALIFIFLAMRAYRARLRWTRQQAARANLLEVFFSSDEQRRLTTAKQQVYEAIYEKGIKPSIREIINSEMTPSYATKLNVSSPEGLSEVYNNLFEISTKAKDQLNVLLQTMPGGSVGIAGPRGAGKTTLMTSLCRSTSTARLNGRSLLGVMVAAPVDYTAREFVLHIFSAVCKKFLQLNKVEEPAQSMEDLLRRRDGYSGPGYSPLLRMLSAFPMPIFMLATSLLTMGLYLAIWQASPTNIPVQPAAQAKPPDAISQADKLAPSGESAQPSASGGQPHQPGVDNLHTIDNFGAIISKLDISPGFLFRTGLVFLGLGIAGIFLRFELSRRTEHPKPDSRPSREHRDERISKVLDWLEEIHFQQSYSSGWSGSLQIPVGISAGVNSAINVSLKQRSFPDIVDSFRSMVSEITRDYEVVIGIDELDKMSDDRTAYKFMNDIKVIFGIDHCYFLISISENAMSSFERRGMPFRDVFDSALDDVVYVNYLTITDARRLLNRRVIGLPVPFVFVCFALSGGLPRDLIRLCRKMVSAEEALSEDLYTLSASIVEEEVGLKIRAAIVTAQREGNTARREAFLQDIAFIEQERASAKMDKSVFGVSTALESGLLEKNGDETDKLTRLSVEIRLYIYFCETLLRLLDPQFGVEISTSETQKDVESLSLARQYFAVDTIEAKKLIAGIRSRRHLNYIGRSRMLNEGVSAGR